MDELINTLKFDASGLIPAVVQNIETNEVLMVAYMNADTIKQTLETGRATFGGICDQRGGKVRGYPRHRGRLSSDRRPVGSGLSA